MFETGFGPNLIDVQEYHGCQPVNTIIKSRTGLVSCELWPRRHRVLYVLFQPGSRVTRTNHETAPLYINFNYNLNRLGSIKLPVKMSKRENLGSEFSSLLI